MFVNDQDTALLHGALMSAANWMQSNDPNMVPINEHSINLKDKKGVVDIVSSTVIKLTQDTSKVKTGMEFLKMQLHLNRRLHSVIFFVTLRSNDITCTEANNYYESIPHTFPSMDWKFYLKLNHQCNWSEYFIECARQLKPDILAVVIKSLLPICEEADLVHYAWHISLQSIVWKFFHLDDPSFMEPEEFPFEFPFEDCRTTSKRTPTEEEVVFCESPARSKLLHAYVTILNHMLQASKTSLSDFTFTKVVLHFYKTIFKLLKKTNACSGESVKELFRMNPLLEQCLIKEPLHSAIKSFLRVPENTLLSHCYVNTSWDICASYLLFLVCNYWKEAAHHVERSFHSISSVLPPAYNELLVQLCPLFKENICEDDRNVRLLKAIILYDYPFASRAAGILLVHKEVRTRTEIINVLKEHVSKLSPVEIYPLLADAIVETDSTDIKNTFLNLFFHILSNASCNLYNDALTYIYGVYEHFKLPDADSHLIQFTRQTMLFDEAKKILLPLFLQMPLVVLKTLIDQAFIRGAEGIAIIPVLKHIPSVCYHNNNFPLLEELSCYFLKKDLQTHEEKNFLSLIESVMEVQTEEEILLFDKFLELCILPSVSKKIRIDLALECLNVSLKIVTSKTALNLSNDSFFSLMECLTFIIDDCIKTGNGKRKELVLLTLSLLGENKTLHGKFSEGSPHFIKHLSNLETVVIVYLKPFCEKETFEDTVNISGLFEFLWIYCCQSEDPKLEFNKRLSSLRIKHDYSELLRILVPLLSHFTKKEWIRSSYFVKEYFEYFSPDTYFGCLPSLFPQSDIRLYAVVRTLMDCYGFVLQISSCDKQYVTSCFTNTVMTVLGQKSHPQLLLNVFIDACHLTSISEMDTLHLLSPFLIGIQKTICQACENKLLQANYLKLTLTSVKCLPDSEAKSSLLQKL